MAFTVTIVAAASGLQDLDTVITDIWPLGNGSTGVACLLAKLLLYILLMSKALMKATHISPLIFIFTLI